MHTSAIVIIVIVIVAIIALASWPLSVHLAGRKPRSRRTSSRTGRARRRRRQAPAVLTAVS